MGFEVSSGIHDYLYDRGEQMFKWLFDTTDNGAFVLEAFMRAREWRKPPPPWV